MSRAKRLAQKLNQNEAISPKDEILGGIDVGELVDTVSSNEKEVNEKSVMKVYNEILKFRLDDAKAVLKKNMKDIIKMAQ